MAGGSSMLDLGNDEPVGDKNVAATKEILADAAIDLVDDDTGGSSGRSVTFDPSSGVMRIERVNAETTEL
jgi:chemotaxis protein CheD